MTMPPLPGTQAQPPAPVTSPGDGSTPSFVAYRIGTFSSFRRRMLDQVASGDLLAELVSGLPRGKLDKLQNPFLHWHEGAGGDYHTTLIELWAYLADILTFYQERIANEAFLPTATQRDSLLRVAEAIDYRPPPGTAATALLAFSLDDGKTLTLPGGLRVSGKPPGDQPAPVFETHLPFHAFAEHNAIPVAAAAPSNQFASLDDYAAVDGRLVVPANLASGAQAALRPLARNVYGTAGFEHLESFVVEPLIQVSSSGNSTVVRGTITLLKPGDYLKIAETADEITGTAPLRTVVKVEPDSQGRTTTITSAPADHLVRTLLLAGSSLELKPGDNVLVVENEGQPSNSSHPEKTTLKQLLDVVPQPETNSTRVSWSEEPGRTYDADSVQVSVYALPVKASLFGNEAPSWSGLSPVLRGLARDVNNNLVLGPYAAQNWDDGVDLLNNPWPYLPTPGDALNAVYLAGAHEEITATPERPGWAVLMTDEQLWRLTDWRLVTAAPLDLTQGLAWAGRFTGSGPTQLLAYQAGTWRLGSLSDGVIDLRTTLAVDSAPREPGSAWVGDFSGSGNAQLLMQVGSSWQLGRVSDGLLAWNEAVATQAVTPALAWSGDFLGAGRAQLLIRSPDDSWKLGTILGDPVAGYRLQWTVVDPVPPGVTPSLDLAWVGEFGDAGHDQLLVYSGDAWQLGSLSTGSGNPTLAFAKLTTNASEHGGVDGTLSFGDELTPPASPPRTPEFRSWAGRFTASARDDLLIHFSESGDWWRGSLEGPQLLWRRVAQTPGSGPGLSARAWIGAFTGSRDQLLFAPPRVEAEAMLTWQRPVSLTKTPTPPPSSPPAVSTNLVLAAFTSTEPVRAFHVTAVQPLSKVAYSISAKATRLDLRAGESVLAPDGSPGFAVRKTRVLAGSRRLALQSSRPLPAPVGGDLIVLGGQYPNLSEGQTVIVRGQLFDAPPAPAGGAPAGPATGAEARWLSGAPAVDKANNVTSVSLAAPLTNRYVRKGAQLMANVVSASHGETISHEVLGSGNGRPFQSLPLKKGPLSYLSTGGPQGQVSLKSTLTVTVNGVAWAERDSLRNSAPDSQHYQTAADDSGTTIVTFGDGVHGACPPSGVNNIRASYRKGSGGTGNRKLNTLTDLVDAVPGLKSVTNPLPGSGGSDMPGTEQLRANATLSARVSGPIITTADYLALALSYPGVAKAAVTRAAAGPGSELATRPQLQLAIAASDGRLLGDKPGFAMALKAYLDRRRDTNVGLLIVDYTPVYLDVGVTIDVADGRPQRSTLQAAIAALNPGRNADGSLGYFAFERVQFGQHVRVSVLQAVLLAVDGVKNARVTVLRRLSPVPEPHGVSHDIVLTAAELPMIRNDPADTGNLFGKLAIELGSGGFFDP